MQNNNQTHMINQDSITTEEEGVIKKKIIRKVARKELTLGEIVWKSVVEYRIGECSRDCECHPPLILLLPLTSLVSIDNIICSGHIHVFNARNGWLTIRLTFEPDEIEYHKYFDETRRIREDFGEVNKVVDMFLKKIPLLRYETMTCKFVDQTQLEARNAFQKLLIGITSVAVISDTCAICFEVTRAKTECNHSLCVPCGDKMTKLLALENEVHSDDDDDEEEDKPCYPACPLCRKRDNFRFRFN